MVWEANISRFIQFITVLAVFLVSQGAGAADQNHFLSMSLNGKKIGQVHYTVRYHEKGMVEEVKTRSSVSILGIKLHYFTQDLHEVWKDEELKSIRGYTDDHGKIYELSLQRNPKEYDAVLNSKPLTLPHDAFPTSVWHYNITQKSLLFDLKDLRLMKVKVSESKASVTVGERSIPASRFDFSGEWETSVWYDQNKQLLKIKYKIKGREIVVTMDPKL